MSKKFTSFLVLVTALLLTVPTHAQLVKKVAKQQAISLKAGPIKAIDAKKAKAAKAKAEDNTVGIAFTGGKHQESSFQWNWASHAIPQFVPNSGKSALSMYAAFIDPVAAKLDALNIKHSEYAAGSRRAQVDPSSIITSIPATAEVKYYNRSGSYHAYNSTYKTYSQVSQKGIAAIAFDGDDVYIQNPVAGYTPGSWVKGTKSGNTITIPLGQLLFYNTSENYGLYITLADVTTEFVGTNDTAATEITYTIDGNTITQNGTSATRTLTVAWTDDDTVYKYGAPSGEFGTVFTLNETYQPASTELVELPTGATVNQWYAVGEGSKDVPTDVNVAIVDNEVYVSGLNSNFPNSWFKGTLEGNKVTFKSFQYLGLYSSYNVWVVAAVTEGTSFVLKDNFTMTYDAVAKTLTLDPDQYVLFNAADDRPYYLAYIDQLTIYSEAPAPVQIDELPYAPSFAATSDQAAFTFIDANGDGKTWKFDKDNATPANTVAVYSFASKDADDWLVTPAIKLEAGKAYYFGIDAAARSATYPEKFEVLLGAEPSADKLTKSVIPVTEVKWTAADGYKTFENGAVTVDETGYYYFGIHAISVTNMWSLYVNNLVVKAGAEAAAPAAVSDFIAEQAAGELKVNVGFKAPTKNIAGENLTDLTKIDVLRNGEVVKSFTESLTPGADMSFADEVPAMGTYSYQVIPYNASGEGQKSDIIDVFVTVTQQVPYIVNFSNEGVIDFFQVIDANGDGKTWAWSKSYNAYNKYNTEADADDYLISLPIALEAGKKYDVIVNANAGMEDYPERFEVKVGKEATVDGLTITAIEPTEVVSEEGNDFKGTFTATESGNYYVAIHAISDKDNYYLCINKLTVDVAPLGTAPAAVTDLAVAAGAQGALEANITFTAPSKNLDGDALTENLSKIEIIRNDVVVKTIENVVPGSAQAWKDEDVENGETYVYQVVGYNASGKGLISEKVSVYVGTDVPAIESVSAIDNGTSVTLTWTKATTEGPNGGYVDPAKVKYEVWSMKVVSSIFGSYLDYDELLGTVTDGNSYDVTLNTDEGAPAYKYWTVKPVNEVGEGEGSYTSLLIGASYDLPYADSFTEGSNYVYEYDGSVYLSEESSDGDDYSLMLTAEEEPGVFTVNTGKIDIKNAANPTLIFKVKGIGVDKMNVVASVNGGEFQTLAADVTVTNEFAVVKVPLASIKNARYVKLGFQAAIQNLTVAEIDWTTYETIYYFGDQLLIDELRVVDLYEYNLKAEIVAPAAVAAGQKAKVVATVTNEGENAAKDYTVTIKAGDKTLITVIGDEELAPFAKDEIEVDFETSIFDEAGDVTLTVDVDYENELNPDDNTASTIITVKESTAAVPENFTATDKGSAGVDLAWVAPTSSTAETTEDFSAYENGANETGLVGDWTLVNNNGETKGAMFEDLELANDGQAKAWQVFKPSEYGITNPEFNGPNGSLDESYIVSAYNLDGQSYPDNDDWLISPELPGVAQEISFSIAALSVEYGPSSYEVLISTTDNQIESFTKVAEETLTATGWAEKTVELPAGTKYFAIRNNTPGDGAMCVMLGNISFQVGGSSATAFNIYYEQEKIASVEGDKTTYTVAVDKLTAGDHTFAITAVYANGVESKPVTATVTVTTDIRQIAVDGKPVDIYSVDGKLVRKQATSLNGLKGLYVVNGKKIMIN